jgi:DNA repair protein RadC
VLSLSASKCSAFSRPSAFAIIAPGHGETLAGRGKITASPPLEYHVGLKDLPSDVRPRERLRQDGAESLSTTELLAIILRTGSRRANVLELANSLLARHRGLEGLSRAGIADMCTQVGLGPAKAIQLKAAFELGRRMAQFEPAETLQVRSPGDLAPRMIGSMSHLEQEHLRVILLNTKNRVLADEEICRGSLNSAAVRISEVFREPIRQNAAAIILVHNHPSGDPEPSREDARLTELVRDAGELLDVELLDHLVIGRRDFVSLRERGLGFTRSTVVGLRG